MNSRKKAQKAQKVSWAWVFELSDIVRETSFDIHRFLRHGHLEKVYENALYHRLGKLGMEVSRQCPLVVRDEDGTILGEYFADLLIEQTVIVELKACRDLTDDHMAQILGYLRASRIEHGLLINFGARKLQIRKVALSQ